MQIKLTRPLACVDLETTGVDVNEDRIVQIAIVRLDPNGDRTTKSRVVNPGRPIPAEATAIHRITNSIVIGKPHFYRIAQSLARLLSDCDLTGYNIRSFDAPMLTAEFARHEIVWPAADQLIVDSYDIFKRQEPQKLAQALTFYTGEVMDPAAAHDATVDAEAALHVLLGQAQHYIGDERCTLEDMQHMARDPDWVDTEGKLRWINGVACVNFGKWYGVPIQQVEKSYFTWVAKADFPEDFQAICRAAKDGVYPVRGSGDGTPAPVQDLDLRDTAGVQPSLPGADGGSTQRVPATGDRDGGRGEGRQPAHSLPGAVDPDTRAAGVEGSTVAAGRLGTEDGPGDDSDTEGDGQHPPGVIINEPLLERGKIYTFKLAGKGRVWVQGFTSTPVTPPVAGGNAWAHRYTIEHLDSGKRYDQYEHALVPKLNTKPVRQTEKLKAKIEDMSNRQKVRLASNDPEVTPVELDDNEVPGRTGCTLCSSLAARPGGWTHAAAFTFTGRVHNKCLALYSKMKPLWWAHYHDGVDGAEDWQGYGKVLEAMGTPRKDDGWDIESPEFKVCEHAWRNARKLFEMMRDTGYGAGDAAAEVAPGDGRSVGEGTPGPTHPQER